MTVGRILSIAAAGGIIGSACVVTYCIARMEAYARREPAVARNLAVPYAAMSVFLGFVALYLATVGSWMNALTVVFSAIMIFVSPRLFDVDRWKPRD